MEPLPLRFRNLVTFGTGEAAPSPDTIETFSSHARSLTGPVGVGLSKRFVMLDHDMAEGSDRLFILEGLIGKAAAEVWATDAIVQLGLAPLTSFHHARALYEAHALAYWLLADFANRWQRVLKESIRERLSFEKECTTSIGAVKTDITDVGRELLEDGSVKEPPSVKDQVVGHPVLEFDYALFWKYSSAHVHPGHIGMGEIDPETERSNIEWILGGAIRHSAGIYREISSGFNIPDFDASSLLVSAEEYSKYTFDLPGGTTE
jgi:hypothetical protein